MAEPQQKPGRSKQDYGTPWEFIRSCEARFGKIICDLAASAENAKCERFFSRDVDSLSQPWAALLPTGVLFLNPEFANIAAWSAKCAEESAKRHGLILLLTPASIGTDWFSDSVLRHARVLGLRPRIPFDGMPVNPKTGRVDGYPKDLMLSVYGAGQRGIDSWRWKP